MTRIVVSGNAVMDFVFHVGAMPRTAEKHRAKAARIVGGGNAANAAVTLARLGAETLLATRLGDDEMADMIVHSLHGDGVDTRLTRRFEAHHSSFSSVFIDDAGERQIVSFRDWEMPARAGWLQAALPVTFDAALSDTRWPEGALAMMLAARAIGKPGIIDAEAPIADAHEAMAQASHVAFSAQGLRDYVGHGDLERGLWEAHEGLAACVLVTNGHEGTRWIEDGALRRLAPPAIVAVDTLGAGDVWHGAFALKIGEGAPLAQAVAFANVAASIKCTRSGGRDGAPRLTEVEEFTSRSETSSPQEARSTAA